MTKGDSLKCNFLESCIQMDEETRSGDRFMTTLATRKHTQINGDRFLNENQAVDLISLLMDVLMIDVSGYRQTFQCILTAGFYFQLPWQTCHNHGDYGGYLPPKSNR